jgi:hypothetical protein
MMEVEVLHQLLGRRRGVELVEQANEPLVVHHQVAPETMEERRREPVLGGVEGFPERRLGP